MITYDFVWDWALLGGLYPAPGEVRNVSTSVYPSACFPHKNIPLFWHCFFFFFFCHIISFSFLKTTDTLSSTLTCHSSPVMCWRPFGAVYLQRKSVFPVLLEDFHHSFNLEKNSQAPDKPTCKSPDKLNCTKRTTHKLFLTLPSPQSSNPFKF